VWQTHDVQTIAIEQVLRIAEGRLDYETLDYPDGPAAGLLVAAFQFVFVFLLLVVTVIASTSAARDVLSLAARVSTALGFEWLAACFTPAFQVVCSALHPLCAFLRIKSAMTPLNRRVTFPPRCKHFKIPHLATLFTVAAQACVQRIVARYPGVRVCCSPGSPLICTQVVALNALVALMGSTYERVMEKKVCER
jgi:hypothetical protein